MGARVRPCGMGGEMSDIKCTCPCIDCIEGNHCGGLYYWPDKYGEEQLIGICEHMSDEEAHNIGIIVDGCDCERCRPELYEHNDCYDEGG